MVRSRLFEKGVEQGGSPRRRTSRREACQRIMRDEGSTLMMAADALDALVAPTGGPAWRTDLLNGDNVNGGSSSSLAAASRGTSVTVPSQAASSRISDRRVVLGGVDGGQAACDRAPTSKRPDIVRAIVPGADRRVRRR